MCFDRSSQVPQTARRNLQKLRCTLVEVQLAVAGLVALAADVVQAFQERRELVEVLQARHVFFAHLFALLASHDGDYAR